MSNISDIIKLFGGITEMSKRMNVPIPTISNWKRKNKIPEWRILEIKTKLGVDISNAIKKGER